MENKSKNTSEISQWIDNYLHISLDTEEYVEVRNFLILWNLFEAKWFKCNFGRNKRNIQNIHLTSDIFNQTLQYLQRRYITNGSTNERFMRLRLRNNDDTTSIQRVLLGLTNNSCDIIKAIIMIIYRYRNNLFHGEKAIASLPMQRSAISARQRSMGLPYSPSAPFCVAAPAPPRVSPVVPAIAAWIPSRAAAVRRLLWMW